MGGGGRVLVGFEVVNGRVCVDSGMGADDLHGDFGGEEGFQAALEVAFDEVVEGAAAAGADEDGLGAVDGGVFGHELGGVGAGVVDGNDGDAEVVGEVEE